MLVHNPGLHRFAAILVALFLVAVFVEAALYARRGRRYAWREAGASALVAIIQRIVSAASVLAIIPLYEFVWSHRLMTIALPPIAQAAVAFVLVEFAYYWMHRASHHFEWMWATHSVHHSAEQLNFPAAIRLGATGFVSLEWLPFVPLALVGISPMTIAILLAFNLFYQFFLHTEVIPRLGRLEFAFNTPAHHAIHHASNPRYIDRNFGGVTILFDRLFGTFAERCVADVPVYGLAGESRGFNPINILFAGWIGLARTNLGSRRRRRTERIA